VSDERHLQSVPASAEQAQRGAHVTRAPFQVGDTLPARLTRDDMCWIFQVGRSQFHRLCRQGKFRKFELRPTIGRTAWSGRLVQAFLDGPVQKRA
jgi:hypothetical protein